MAHPFQNQLLLEDAVRITGPAAFNIMLKPAGSLCNLGCAYCYYLDKADIYGGKEPRMSLEMLETVIREYIAANDVPEVTFNWHGGEPLVLGLDFYRKAMELERKYADGKTVFNTLQTNGTLLTSEWADFLRENRFLVGISIDGPRDIHDKYRKDKGGAGTFDKVIHGIGLLRAHDSVVSSPPRPKVHASPPGRFPPWASASSCATSSITGCGMMWDGLS